MGVQGGRQQGWDRGLRGGRRGVGRGLMLMLMVEMVMVVVVMVVDRGAVVGDDRWGGGKDVGSRGRSRRG